MEPTFLFSNIWLFFLFSSLAFVKFEYNYHGVFYITSLCLVGFVLNLYIGKVVGENVKKKNFIGFNIHKSNFILLGVVSLGMLVPFLNIRLNGFSISSFLSFDDFLEMNNQMAVNRYNGAHKTSTVMQILMVFEYLSPIIGGYHFASVNNKKNKLLGLLGFLPALSNILVQNTKSEFLSSMFFFVSSMMIANVYLGKDFRIKFSSLVKWTLTLLGALSGLILTMLFRIGEITSQNVHTVLNKFLIYAFGHVPTFDYWLGNYHETFGHGLGINTFIGIFNFLGISTRIRGVYSEYIIVEGFPANIYTVFRGLIEDFGVIGSFIFFSFIMGIVIFSYYSLIKRNNIYLSSFILLNGYFFVFYGFIISPWSYMSYILAMFLFLPYLIIVRSSK
ncbi:O-antigen polymerase [Weissella jogaejeotgali]|nr:O-antigen polymerase [Weissella jogaejeotgali]